jgi:hypothetical protein
MLFIYLQVEDINRGSYENQQHQAEEMCDMSSYFAPNTGGYGVGVGGAAGHVDQHNGDYSHHTLTPCHENGRGGPPAHHQYPQIPFNQPGGPPGGPNDYGPRYPPYRDMKHIDGTNLPHDPSPYYNYGNAVVPPPPTSHPSQGPPPGGPGMGQQQYDSCGSRGSITPPHDQQPQYASCKMQQPMHPHSDGMPGGPPNMVGGSPTPPHHGPPHHQMYQGPVASPPGQNSGSALPSPLYPWMRSQFGE